MHETEHCYRDDDGRARKVRDLLVGTESEELRKLFEQRQAEAIAAHTKHLEADPQATLETREVHNIGRNDSCPCGSGTKFKKCCGSRLSDSDERIG